MQEAAIVVQPFSTNPYKHERKFLISVFKRIENVSYQQYDLRHLLFFVSCCQWKECNKRLSFVKMNIKNFNYTTEGACLHMLYANL